MRPLNIILTGGGTGGHFYPLIAVAQSLREIEKSIGMPIQIKLFGDKNFDPNALRSLNVEFVEVQSGKRRTYASFRNITDMIKLAFSIPIAFFRLLFSYPDVIFSKGGHASIPTLWAARLLNIPVVIHESDSVPGRTTRWSSKFASRIAVSYEHAGQVLAEELTKKNKDTSIIQVTGQPMRKNVLDSGDFSEFDLASPKPTMVIVGGSQGALALNETVVTSLPQLLQNANVIHQTGPSHFRLVQESARSIMDAAPSQFSYRPYAFLEGSTLSAALTVADIVVTRAGSMLFEIAARGIPSIVIPIHESNGDHQRENAYALARAGGAVVIEEPNLTPNILVNAVEKLLGDPANLLTMQEKSKQFSPTDASFSIASELVRIAQSHV